MFECAEEIPPRPLLSPGMVGVNDGQIYFLLVRGSVFKGPTEGGAYNSTDCNGRGVPFSPSRCCIVPERLRYMYELNELNTSRPLINSTAPR